MPAKVLVVDDEPDLEILVRQKFRREIRAEELFFEFARNGVLALETLRKAADIQVVLTDIHMPEMDGLTLLQKLAEAYPNLRTVVISANGDMPNIRTAMNRGAYDFLTKPIDFQDLKITLRRTLEHVAELQRQEEAKNRAEAMALISERRANEAQNKLIRQLKRQDKLKDEFLAKTSHELRTPLNGIIGIVESLIDGATGKLSTPTVDNLRMVANSGRRLATLVDDILDFSKMKSETLFLDRQAVDLTLLVEEIFALSKPLLAGKDLKLENQVPAGFPPLLADPNRLRQILHNLVGNAIKFSRSGRVTVTAEVEGEMASIAIEDTGIGIPAEKFNDIFEMFEQVDQSSTRDHSGTGLGLAITRNLVRQHGGDVHLTSVVGKGSTFKFNLPIARDLPAAPISDPDPRPPRIAVPEPIRDTFADFQHTFGFPNHGHILVVDDEPTNQQVLANHLSLRRYKVTKAFNGIEALQLIESKEGFDLVILDLMMPGMSGFEVCRALRQRYSNLELPVLMLTARDQSKDLVEGFESGANDYVTKPFDKRELLSRVDTLVSLRKAISATSSKALELEREQRRSRDLEEKADAFAASEAEAREGARQKEDLLAMMSHELRTPLSSIIGYSEMLQEDFEMEERHTYVPDVLKIQNSAKHLLALIDNLLEISKIDHGKMPLTVERFELRPLIDQVCATIDPLVSKNGNVLTLDCSPEPVYITTDQTKIQQILLNLLSNACKFTTRGQISLSYRLEGADAVMLEVRDTGIGMTATQLNRIFNPFTQAETWTSRNYGGTGLGLVICKRFCELMGGDLGVASELGKGSTFWVKLPLESRGHPVED